MTISKMYGTAVKRMFFETALDNYMFMMYYIFANQEI